MKGLRILCALAAVAAAAGLAWAGGCGTGFGCQNKCPLAQQASQCRAYGAEAPAAAQALADQVAKNLAKI